MANDILIMCTLTVNQIVEDDRLIADMYDAGMRAVRINTAHLSGTAQLHAIAARLKALLPSVRILIDTKGPEMRTTAIAAGDAVCLTPGTAVTVAGTDDDTPSSAEVIYVNYPKLHTEVSAGGTLLIDDGRISLRVTAIDGTAIKATVTAGGMLGDRKGIAVAGVDVCLPPLSRHDPEYLAFAASSALIDEVAHSFVRSADDVLAVKAAMGACHKPVIAKIENQQGIDNLDDIIRVSDGILIARGDLTASIGRDAVPDAQAYIAAKTKDAARPLYLATGILPSMMASPTPSAPDIEGIRTAMRQGVDVMLLTNETAAGAFPLASVEALHRALA